MQCKFNGTSKRDIAHIPRQKFKIRKIFNAINQSEGRISPKFGINIIYISVYIIKVLYCEIKQFIHEFFYTNAFQLLLASSVCSKVYMYFVQSVSLPVKNSNFIISTYNISQGLYLLKVYKKGLTAEFIGKTKITTHAYICPEMTRLAITATNPATYRLYNNLALLITNNQNVS